MNWARNMANIIATDTERRSTFGERDCIVLRRGDYFVVGAACIEP